MSGRDTILLTGASGVVGRAVLRELPAGSALGMVHGTAIGAPGVEPVTGDLSLPRFGLDQRDYDALARRVTAVVHSGALTEWGRPAADYRAINIEGTRHVIDFARLAGAPVHYISTSFVAALGSAAPRPPRPENIVLGYITSKKAAEELLADSGVPHVVYRPTNLIGDSRTGETSKGQIVQLMSDWVARGKAKIFPAHPGNLIDIVPQDLLAKSVVRAIDAGVTGREYWVTFGKRAMTVADALAILIERGRAAGRRIEPPRIVHPDDITEAELAAMPAMSRTYVTVLTDVSDITACSGGALPSSMDELRTTFDLPEISDQDAYRISLEAAARG